MLDLLVTGARVVDPANGVDGIREIAIASGRVVGADPPEISRRAARTIDASGKWVFPGLVDTHVHVSEPFGGFQGFPMLARAGVTCALDLAGFPDSLVKGLSSRGTGITLGYVYPLIPGETVSSRDPDRGELARVIDDAVDAGALGIKLLGGHFPFTPDATARAIRLSETRGIRCAVHAGTTETGSDVEGLEELPDLAAGSPVHVAHINSYCRGQKEEPLLEAHRALAVLRDSPSMFSESYLSPYNGAPARLEDDAPGSRVVRTCLEQGGYPATGRGLRTAIREGWAVVQRPGEDGTDLLGPAAGLGYFEERDSRVIVSFPVNPVASAIALAVAREGGSFVVNALSTDGGAFPRNTTLLQGLSLVRFGALDLGAFVRKACLEPAWSLGLSRKGHLGVGSDADLVVVDPSDFGADWVVAAGKVIVERRKVVGRGGRMLTTRRGAPSLQSRGVDTAIPNDPLASAEPPPGSSHPLPPDRVVPTEHREHRTWEHDRDA